ncbi:MAG: sigma-54 dependent transcriptional regulator [Kiloniellaceae bacterium]
MGASQALDLATPGAGIRVLLVEDSPSLSAVYEAYLNQAGIAPDIAETGAEATAALARQRYDVVLLDLQLPDMDGMELLRGIQADPSPASVVIITSDGSIKTAVQAMRLGAYDFLVKPFNADRLVITLRNAAERSQLGQMVETIRQDRQGFEGFIGASLPMQAVYRMIESAAASKATVFITGESGTGKEVCAEAIHRRSPRRHGPFVPINCGAIPKELIESEIFGHLKGAFTGAIANRDGAAAKAHGGTLFLDEICEMDIDLQTKLLRFTQTGKFQRVGSDRLETADIRIVCATNRDPLAEVAAGRFREDLFYRLHVIPIHLPPLRERECDVVEIARQFLTAYAQEEGRRFTDFAEPAQALLLSYPWPGNVRELQNVVRNLVVLNDAVVVSEAMLRQSLGGTCVPRAAEPPAENAAALQSALADDIARRPLPASSEVSRGQAATAFDPASIKPLWQYEREIIEAAVAGCGGNLSKAAALLQINPSTIYRKRKAWEEADASDPQSGAVGRGLTGTAE